MIGSTKLTLVQLHWLHFSVILVLEFVKHDTAFKWTLNKEYFIMKLHKKQQYITSANEVGISSLESSGNVVQTVRTIVTECRHLNINHNFSYTPVSCQRQNVGSG